MEEKETSALLLPKAVLRIKLCLMLKIVSLKIEEGGFSNFILGQEIPELQLSLVLDAMIKAAFGRWALVHVESEY